MKLIQRTNPVGDNKRKLAGPMLLLLALLFENDFRHTYMIIVGAK